MAFPRKFKSLLETDLRDVEQPNYACMTYAVCGCEQDSCGWGGWILEAAFRQDGQEHDSWTGDRNLPVDDSPKCPRCRKPLFRTGASVKVETTGPFPPSRFPYEATTMEYED